MATRKQEEVIQEVSSDTIGECVVIKSCEPCTRKHLTSTATIFCNTCNELLCGPCKNIHIIYKSGKHDTIDLANLDSAPVLINMKGMDKCREHSKKIKFFCEDHSKLCCSTCAFIHRKCDNVKELTSVSTQESAGIQDLMSSLLKLESETSSIIADCKQSEAVLNETIAKLPVEVDEMRDSILNILEKAKNKMMSEANNFKEQEATRLGQRNEASSKVKNDIDEILPVCSALVEHGTSQQKYIITKTIKEKIKEIEIHIIEQRNTHITSKVSLTFPNELTSILTEKEDIVKLNDERFRTHTGSSNSSISSSTIKSFTLELLVSVDLKQTGDDTKEPCLSGLDFLTDGRLVAVDNLNWKCIILDDLLQRQGTPYKFKTFPYGILCLSHCELAVTLFNKTVCLLSVSPDNVISLTREINTSSKFISICCMTPSNMVVNTYDEPRSARMISVDGVESEFDHVVFPKTYKHEESKCTYVQSKNTLVLTDRYAHTVYMYDTVKGTSRAVTDESIQEPRGACVGPSDTVLVSSTNKNSIVHLTVDGDLLGTYPVDMQRPYSLCMNKDGTRLAVSNNATGKRKLLVYKILQT